MRDWIKGLPDAAQAYLEGRRLDEVECVIADLPGIARGKAVPASKFARQTHFYLPDSIFYQTITGDWGEAAGEGGFVERDMTLVPDMDTATAAPWTGDWTLQVIHDAQERDGTPIPFAPRNVLKRVVGLVREMGYEPVVAPEMEFFLVARNFEIDGITQEGGAGQLEINLRHGDPVKLADEVFYFKRLIREAALRHDCFATFMAKPIADEPGSAMHIHHSLIDIETGRNAFAGPQGGETDAFFHFIGGMQQHMPAALAVMAPYVNSYRRFVKDHAAPINLEWGRDNRTTGIRVPLSSPQSRRVENRIAGMDCNPYLAIAASLACGYLGMRDEIRAGKQFRGDAYEGEGDIPRVLGRALDLFDEAEALHEILGTEFARVYGIVKRAEYDEFLQVISPWEREHLLLNV
jgi:glutamine synthetase